MEKQIIIEKYSYFYPHYEYTNPILLCGLIYRYTKYNDYNKVSVIYSQQSNSNCYYFMKVHEETDQDYKKRMKLEEKLEKIDVQVNDLILKISGNYLTKEDYDGEEYKKDCKSLKKLTNKYSFILMESASEYEMKFDLLDTDRFVMKSRKQELEIRAFKYKNQIANKMITEWNKTHESREFCPFSYQDTLLIPFQKIEFDYD